ncbi:MAG: hypothetical protein GX621_07060, partial [Pirellulaceae bacterium]|nr:hypothetical protein [Pirellulaceae bacterium]
EPAVKPLTNDSDQVTSVSVGPFDRKLKHSLGYLNEGYGAPRPSTDPNGMAGYARRPFPWLTWLNRPYTNALELLYVPIMSSSRLLAYDEANYYAGYRIVRESDTDPKTYAPTGPVDVPFPHLANFFQSSKTAGNAPEFHRIFEFVRVHSPFVGAETQANVATAAGGTNHRYNPPHHHIPRYREPGRINLNTIYSEDVFRGLLNLPDRSSGLNLEDPAATQTLWDAFVASRRGYGVPGGTLADMVALDTTTKHLPTRFATPFRSFAGARLVPISDLEPRSEADATIFRAYPPQTLGGPQPERPLFSTDSPYNFNHTDRNPFFRYQSLARLGNLVTTRSNVNAVWITVGYFEVTPAPSPVDTNIYPDGYRLGKELGQDMGESQRHRAFFILDRSIPVGFRRGKTLNTENAILVKRFIE